MDLQLVSKTSDEITVAFLNSDESFVYLLLEELWRDKKVANATYKNLHPTLDNPTITVKVTEGKPQTALKRAAKSVTNQFKEIRESFEKVSG